MKILLINPNTASSVFELFRAEAVQTAAPDTQIKMVTSTTGVDYIGAHFEALLGGNAAADLAARQIKSWMQSPSLPSATQACRTAVRYLPCRG